MTDLPKLPPYIYGRETGANERVWTEAAMHAYGRACIEADRAQRAEPVLLTGAQVLALADFLIPDCISPINSDMRKTFDEEMESEACIQRLPERVSDDGEPMPAGLYAWIADYPEEGCVLLDAAPQEGHPT